MRIWIQKDLSLMCMYRGEEKTNSINSTSTYWKVYFHRSTRISGRPPVDFRYLVAAYRACTISRLPVLISLGKISRVRTLDPQSVRSP